MKIAKDLTQLIGGTPLVALNKLNKDAKAQVIVKLEYMNPGCSCKDHIAMNMINKAEQEGKIKAGVTTLIEATSGNTGISLAYICAIKGYDLIICMPENNSIERRMLLNAYGARVVLTPANLRMKGAVDKAHEIEQEMENAHILYQFQNPANPEIHRLETAEEIWNDTDGKIDIVVAGVGTGGTITGIAQNLKAKKASFQAIAVEPANSAVLSGCEPGCHRIEGIGTGFVPDVLDRDLIDEIYQVEDHNAIETTRQLAKKEGILCGIAGGASTYAALELAKRPENEGKLILAVLTDSGERYLSTRLFEETNTVYASEFKVSPKIKASV
ncbi:MAG: cysteine synthase A [bacterium]